MAQRDNEADFMRDLGNLIAEHAHWLDGETFLALTHQAGQGYFDDFPDVGAVFIEALAAALEDAAEAPDAS